jgi:hypothetical protein
MDPDYSDPKTVAFALEEWGSVFRKLPRIDAIFVPGDPGHTEPKYLMALLESRLPVCAAITRRRRYGSPQSFDKAWFDEFIGILDTEPVWLTGIVFGPQVRGSIADLRARVPKKYRFASTPISPTACAPNSRYPPGILPSPLPKAAK